MKKIIVFILLMCLIPLNVFATNKVKVYVFEAGGCPYCELQKDYLTNLAKSNDKFEVIVKEMYIDHYSWEHGKDYELGKKVAQYFTEKGFKKASADATPFVVISDLYAAAEYNVKYDTMKTLWRIKHE